MIRARDLATQLGYPIGGNQETLRQLIKECIEIDGDLIGVVTGRNNPGFFLISAVQELERYLDSLEGRTRSDNDIRTALLNSWNSQPNIQHTNRQILTIQ